MHVTLAFCIVLTNNYITYRLQTESRLPVARYRWTWKPSVFDWKSYK